MATHRSICCRANSEGSYCSTPYYDPDIPQTVWGLHLFQDKGRPPMCCNENQGRTCANILTHTSMHASDLSNFTYSGIKPAQVIVPTMSWLAINPVVGCPLECIYCFSKPWGLPKTPTVVVDPIVAVTELFNHPLFIRDHTPLAINLSSTDPILLGAKAATFRCLELLDDSGVKNIVSLTTKIGVTRSEVDRLIQFKHIKIVLLISYSGMPWDIEPVRYEPRLKALVLLKNANVPSILYYRPIVEGWNDSERTMRAILSIGENYTNAIAIGGLRLSSEIRAAISQKVARRLIRSSNNYAIKIFSKRLISKVVDLHHSMNLSVPLFKHTSCAVSFIFKMPNYNSLFMRPTKHCLSTCPQQQKLICRPKSNKLQKSTSNVGGCE